MSGPLKRLVKDVDIKEIRYFSASTPPGCPGENLQAQKWTFWMVSVEFDHRLPAELPLTVENHWFPPRFNLNQILDPHGEISGFGIEKSCFSQVDPLWMSSEHSWGSEITRMVPVKCQKPSGIMGVDGIHIIPKSQIRFFLFNKNRICTYPL